MLSGKQKALLSSVALAAFILVFYQNFDFAVDQSMSHTNRIIRIEQRTVKVDGNPQQASWACPYVDPTKMYEACKISVHRPVDSDGRIIPRSLQIQQKKGLDDFEYTELGLEVKPFDTNKNYIHLGRLIEKRFYSRVVVTGSAPVAAVLKLVDRNGVAFRTIDTNGLPIETIRKTGVDLTWEFVLPTSLSGLVLEGARVIVVSGHLYLQGVDVR